MEPLKKVKNVQANWQVEFLNAWNNLMYNYLAGQWHKLPQIFVYGPPNVGKTHIVKALCGNLIQNMQVFQPYDNPVKGYTEYSNEVDSTQKSIALYSTING